MGKTRKQPYRKSRRFDRSCRSHGSCPWCFGNRMWRHIKRMLGADEQRAAFDRAMANVSDGPPIPGDELDAERQDRTQEDT